MLIHVLLMLVPFLAGLLLDIDKATIKASTRPLLSYLNDKLMSVVPRQIVYVEVPQRVEVPVHVEVPTQHNSYEMIRIGSQNLLRELVFSLSTIFLQCSWVQLALSITVTCAAVLILVYRIGRPAQASLLPMLNVFNIVKSSRRGRSDESTAGQEKKRLDQGAQQVQDKQETLMPDLKPANYMPGEDVEEWLHFFEQYVERYDKRSCATSLLLSLDKTCHQHGKFGYRASYDELKEKLMTTFAKPEVPESNKTLKACSDSLDEFVQRQRRDDETAVQFLGALEELGQQALSTMAEEMREKHIKSHFMKGLNNDDLKSDILRTMAQTDESSITVKRLKEIVGNYEEWLYRKDSHISSSRSSRSSRSSTSSSSSSSTKSNKGTKAIEKAFNVNKKMIKSSSTDNIQRVDVQRFLEDSQQHNSNQQHSRRDNHNTNNQFNNQPHPARNHNSNSNQAFRQNNNQHNNKQQFHQQSQYQPNQHHQLQQQQQAQQQQQRQMQQPVQNQHRPQVNQFQTQQHFATQSTQPFPQTSQQANQQAPSQSQHQQQQQGSAQQVNAVTANANATRLKGSCVIDGLNVVYEFDSGASMTIINRHVFAQMHNTRRARPFTRKVSSANGSIDNVQLARVRIRLGRRVFDMDVLIAELDPAIDVLLGRDTYKFYPKFARHMNNISKEIRSASKFTKRMCKVRARELDIIQEEPETWSPTCARNSTHQAALLTTLSDDDSEPDTDDELDAVHNSEEYTNMVEEIKLLLEDIAADEFKHLTPGSTIQHAIRLIDPNTKPFRQKMRKVPYSKRDEFYQLIKEQLDANIIAASSSPWSSPVLLVAKPDGSIRLTIDYRWLNDITEKDAHPLPNMECLYTELEKSKYFTKIDCFSGFYQVKLEEASRKYTAFECEWGLFEYQVMPMGLSNSPATFQRLMNIVLHEEIVAGFVVVYIDDILIHSKTIHEHPDHVRRVINRLREHMLKVKLKKCEIAQLKVKFLGQEVSERHHQA